MAFIFVPLTTLTMDPIPKQETGYATSLYSVMRNVGSSIGISFITTYVARRSQFNQLRLGAHVTPYDPATRRALEGARAMLMRRGVDAATAQGSLLFTFGMQNQESDVDRILEVLPPIVERLRNMSPVYRKAMAKKA